MLLDPHEADIFFRLQRTLMFFVNQRLGIVPDVGGPEAYADLPPEVRCKVRDALVGRIDLIDSFVEANPAGFNNDELNTVLSWRHQLAGTFYIFRKLQKWTVFLKDTEPAMAFGVTALAQPFEDLVGPYLPVMVTTVLLPFADKLVYDGILNTYNISFGPGIRRRLNETYRETKGIHGIVTTLPVGSSPVESGPIPKPARTKSKPKKKAIEAGDILERIIALTEAFCREHLNDEYAALCRKLAEKLARKRPSPLLGGKAETWACGIVRTIGWVNYLDDGSNSPHMKLTAIDKAFGVGESTGQGKSKAIRKMFRIGPMDPHWTLPSRLDDNPRAWMIEVNGFVVDARILKPEIQEEALRKGLIPYIPARPQSSSYDDEDE